MQLIRVPVEVSESMLRVAAEATPTERRITLPALHFTFLARASRTTTCTCHCQWQPGHQWTRNLKLKSSVPVTTGSTTGGTVPVIQMAVLALPVAVTPGTVTVLVVAVVPVLY